ncbi:fumarylacetoacetate hydrolase family protein [Hyphomicrobium sp. LHD-15]|uniref:fumarylacetoacetate hydrolase family protein n=1 Tax=Hyphomicrobium sp. LHD-15 TaxID=3072142 RepID=UPI00280FED6C|nr:fumarylacetoacetate hydrolase family protein [Hyphomicrobium sp. LHD-15]MDQ8697335.1 fumarylacetoacetate hydrolase family protein [Hyphomicrobium sp. LHD-15]
MKLRRVWDGARPVVQIGTATGWVAVTRAIGALSSALSEADSARFGIDAVALLGAPDALRRQLMDAAATLAPDQDATRVLMPFEPKSFRDFMFYERHAIDAARGFVRRFMPAAWPIVRAYEATIGAPFPALRPHKLWALQPIYYMGNHLAFAPDGTALAVPSYTRALDYELELGFVLARGLYNATPDEAEAAIGGFVVINDFSARDVQEAEMRSGFGPQKSKHFRNSISATAVSADEILPRWRDLTGFVRINGDLVGEVSTAGPRWSLGEALAHASRSEPLHAGELFATGTLPGGSGIETFHLKLGRLLAAGDTIEIGIEGVGTITTPIITEDASPS